MIDPLTGAAAVVAVTAVNRVGKSVEWAGEKLLGPLLDEIAEGWRQSYEQYRTRNFERVLLRAAAKSPGYEQDCLEANPRVFDVITRDGTWSDNAIMADYFGGLLASSRSREGADDSGLPWVRLIADMSSPEVLLHFQLYEGLRRTLSLLNAEEAEAVDLGKPTVFLDHAPAVVALDDPALAKWQGGEESNLLAAMRGLTRRGLCQQWWIHDPADQSPKIQVGDLGTRNVPVPSLHIAPSEYGFELLMWAFGYSGQLDQAWSIRQEVMDPSTDALVPTVWLWSQLDEPT